MVRSTNLFVDALGKWLDAIRANDFEHARQHAKNLYLNGELLAVHPDFVKCFESKYPNLDSKEALSCLCQVLSCATDGRANDLLKTGGRQPVG